MSKLETNQVDPATGTTLTLGTSGDTISIPSGVTIANSGTATGFGGTTAPYCSVYRSGDQTFSASSWTKIQFNAEHIDSGGVFDSSTNHRFVPTTSGYYFVAVNLGVGITADNAIDQLRVEIYKNGSGITATKAVRDWDTNGINYNDQINTSTIVQLNGSGDYIEGYAYMVVSSGTPRIENSQATMQIFKMTE
jgi:hypothetical protein